MQHGVSPQQPPLALFTSAAASMAGNFPSSSTAPTAPPYPDGNSSDEDLGTPGPGVVLLTPSWPPFGNATESTPSSPTKKHNGSGFRRGHIPKSPTARVATEDPTRAKKTRAARTRRARIHQEHGSLQARVEKELPQRLQQLIDEEEAWKVEIEEVRGELWRIRRSVSEAKNGLMVLHGVEVGQGESKIDEMLQQ